MRRPPMLIYAAALMLAGCVPPPTAPPGVVESIPDEAAMIARLANDRLGDQASALLFFSTAERRVAFKHMDSILPTRPVSAGPAPSLLVNRPAELSAVTYEVEGTTYGLDDFLNRPAQIGLIVVKDGAIVLERYAPGNDAGSLWVSFSVSKSVTSMLIGAAIQDGFIESVDEPITHYLPRLRGTGYEGATIRNILQMSSGVAWNEDYADPQSDVARAGGANGIELVRYLGQLEREHEPGEVFNYNTGETNLVGEVLRAAIGNNAATYLSHKIWQPFGMESDANWVTGGPGSGETGGCCISATLRDYVRLGLFALNDGVLPDGKRVLPEGWMAESISPSKGAPFYGYLWWLDGDGRYVARGIFGQQIYIDPVDNIVIAAHGNASAAVGTDYHEHLSAAIRAIAAAIRD